MFYRNLLCHFGYHEYIFKRQVFRQMKLDESLKQFGVKWSVFVCLWPAYVSMPFCGFVKCKAGRCLHFTSCVLGPVGRSYVWVFIIWYFQCHLHIWNSYTILSVEICRLSRYDQAFIFKAVDVCEFHIELVWRYRGSACGLRITWRAVADSCSDFYESGYIVGLHSSVFLSRSNQSGYLPNVSSKLGGVCQWSRKCSCLGRMDVQDLLTL